VTMENNKDTLKAEEPVTPRRRRKLGEVLMEAGLLSQDQLTRALEACGRSGIRLGDYLVDQAIVSEHDLTSCLSDQLGFLFVDLTKEKLNPELSSTVPEAIAKRYQAVPLRQEGKSLTVAMDNPLDFEAIQDISFLSGCTVKPVLATRSVIKEALEKIYVKQEIEAAIDRITGDSTEEFSEKLLDVLSDTDEPTAAEIQTLEEETRRAPIVRLGNMITTEAVRARSSDIHIEPARKDSVVRFRVDGILREALRLPKGVHSPLISRFKILAKLNIAERRLPQDGAIRLKIERREIDLRVSTLPTLHGEKMVLRITDQSKSLIRLETIGLSEKDYATIKSFTQRHKGLILVTGPTGSGKTTTLYALINAIKSPTLNLLTVEDPVENDITGINQTQVNPDTGLTFANALRTILRQDPDVVLVGEIRDRETAEIAMRAAMTGHLVLSTLHTNDAPSAITRLIDIGIPRYLVASLVEGVIAQRLVRTICPHCKEKATPDPATLRTLRIPPATLSNMQFYAGRGCAQCSKTGYLGRIAIMEILDPSARIREMISAEASEQELRLAALAVKMTTLGEDGLNKAKAGLTSLEELLRVIEVSSKTESLCPTCARIVQYDFMACPYCETTLSRNCTDCKKSLQLEWKTCPYCGTRAGTRRDKGSESPRL
jgi:type IV pilus assembly protein PilB